ncbi:hypothetical protein [Halorubrum sp. DTA46]|uniref:hypothetical protein n=1 Tax=Halorubrum sp. DTA46 TaxID=3402162 RepID=UPI003AABA37F
MSVHPSKSLEVPRVDGLREQVPLRIGERAERRRFVVDRFDGLDVDASGREATIEKRRPSASEPSPPLPLTRRDESRIAGIGAQFRHGGSTHGSVFPVDCVSRVRSVIYGGTDGQPFAP